MSLFAPGDRVAVRPPFGDGTAPMVVLAVQHVTASGEIVAEPSASVQYLLAAEPLPPPEVPLPDGVAFAAEHVEAAP